MLLSNVPIKVRTPFICSITVFLLFFSACQESPVSPQEQFSGPDYSMVLNGSVQRDFSQLTSSQATYQATIQQNGQYKSLVLVFEVAQTSEQESVRNQLVLRVPVNSGAFELKPGNYSLQADPTVLNSLTGRMSFIEEIDPLNLESYRFSAELASFSIDSGDPSQLSGKMLVRFNQDSGFRMVNGVSQDIQLAFGGQLQALLEFDITIQ